MSRLLCLLLAACGDFTTHPPDITELCPRVEVAAYTAPDDGCLLLESERDALFRLDSSENCGGPAVLCLRPGETGYALERVRPAAPARWTVTPVHCPC